MQVDMIKTISEKLQSHGVRPSFPRVKIYEYLFAKRSHPTVDEIYQHLSPGMPTLSRTTVYNTLNLFLKENLVHQINIDEREVRYDATVDEHGHFQCDSCRCIYDFPVNIDGLELNALGGFRIREKNLYLKGVCSRCLITIKRGIINEEVEGDKDR